MLFMNRTLLFLTLFGAACSDPPKSVKGAENGQQSDLGDRDSDGGSEEDGGDSVTCEAFAFTVDGAPCEESCAELVCPCGDHRSTFSSCTPDGCIVDLRCSALCEAGETRAAECDVVYNHAESEPLDYVVYCAEQVAIPAEQCMALAGIDRVFEVANWFDVDSPCGFEGVTCDGEGGVRLYCYGCPVDYTAFLKAF